jgi:hypothetical protein
MAEKRRRRDVSRHLSASPWRGAAGKSLLADDRVWSNIPAPYAQRQSAAGICQALPLAKAMAACAAAAPPARRKMPSIPSVALCMLQAWLLSSYSSPATRVAAAPLGQRHAQRGGMRGRACRHERKAVLEE